MEGLRRKDEAAAAIAERPVRGVGDRPRPRTRPHRRTRLLVLAGSHLFVLSAFALAQPLFDLLAQNAEFFAVRESTRTDILEFTVGVLLVPPAALLVLEALALLAGALVWRGVHLLFVALLCALIVLQVVQRIDEESGVALLVVAGLAGAALAAAYLHVPPARTFLTLLVPAPLVFAAIFLFASPVTRLVFPEKAREAAAARVDGATPVVLIVFDEFKTVALLDERERVDAKRFPRFAELAADATFYRDATTVHAWTEHAVPSILTGLLPEDDELPIHLDHPDNLFTLVRRGYRLNVQEALTHLCPSSLCKRRRPATAAAPEGEAATVDSFASDVSIVYLHVLLPDSLAERLPPIDRSWRDFRGNAVVSAGDAAAAAPPPPCLPVCALVRSLDPSEPASLYYQHVLVPHPTWKNLPSGKQYLGDTRTVPGLDRFVWGDDAVLINQAYARYLLQAGFADRALGLVLDRLRETGLYDRALVVVVSDHGVNFDPGQPRREAMPATLHETAFVPLFVKLPGQERGRIQDGFARTVDVLPTIADVIGVRVPWEPAGRSLAAEPPPSTGTVSVMDGVGRLVERPLAELVAERRRDLRAQTASFGTGSWDALYRAGPAGHLVGRRLGDLRVEPAEGLRVEVDGRALFEAVDPESPLVPAYVTGRLEGVSAGRDVAIVVNGTVAGTARTYDERGDTRFAALVPERTLRPGRNDLVVLLVDEDGETLHAVVPTEPELALEGDEIRPADGSGLTPDPAAIVGQLKVSLQPGRVDFHGWAADRDRGRPVDAIAVFVDGRLLYTAPSSVIRSGVPAEREGIEDVGLGFALPASLLPERGSDHEVRVFALSGDRAAELTYAVAYPWRS